MEYEALANTVTPTARVADANQSRYVISRMYVGFRGVCVEEIILS